MDAVVWNLCFLSTEVLSCSNFFLRKVAKFGIGLLLSILEECAKLVVPSLFGDKVVFWALKSDGTSSKSGLVLAGEKVYWGLLNRWFAGEITFFVGEIVVLKLCYNG